MRVWFGIAAIAGVSFGASYAVTRAMSGDDDSRTVQGSGHPTQTYAEQDAPATPQIIEVTGSEFVWRFRYLGPDELAGTPDDVITEGELVLPLGQPVELRLTSTDYIYTFRAPEIGLLESAIPALEFTLAFTPAEVGQFLLEIDPHCGNRELHDNDTMGFISVVTPEAYRDRLTEAQARPHWNSLSQADQPIL